jgi:UDP-4-amino-4,6-dideoxy-N-acetyl-beta-L-altrosamine transaminase
MEFNIPYGKQHITQDDIDAVTRALKADLLTQGPRILEFETAFAEYVGSKYAIAVSNGTAALHLSALALGVKSGDQVITSPITFSASANCIEYCGGTVVFADIDPDTYLLSIDSCRSLLENAEQGAYKGIIPVDFAGLSVDMEAFRALAIEYDLFLLEDSCHAPGGGFESSDGFSLCGSGKFADMAIFSFHPVKHIAAGEGGMITTNSKSLYQKIQLLRTHGITKDPSILAENHGAWYYEMHELGYNYRLTDFQCALGLSQLLRANIGLERRNHIASVYRKAFKDLPIRMQHHPNGYKHAFHLFVIEVAERLELYNYMKENGIHTQVHYIPVHLMPYYKRKGYKKGNFPNAENYYSSCLSLPMYPTLSEEEQRYVIEQITDFYGKK